jgi:hypothetical protein
MRDANFLSGKFFDLDIPKEKRYLLKYFRNDLQRAFLRYYLVFGEVWNFTDHTGYYCSKRLAFRLANRYKRLTKLHQEAKISLDEDGIEIVELLERGKYRLTRLPKS